MPKYSNPASNCASAPSENRAWSVSSIRSRYTPPLCLARSRLTLAVKIPPMCSQPVGDGANLVTKAPAGSERAGYRDSQWCGDGRSAGKSESVSSTLSMGLSLLVTPAWPAKPAAGRPERLVLADDGGDRGRQPGPWLRPELVGQPRVQVGGARPGGRVGSQAGEHDGRQPGRAAGQVPVVR